MKTGHFTHDGVLYDLEALSRLCNKLQAIPFDIDDLKWVLDHCTPDRERLLTADAMEPIYVAHDSKGRLTVVDGIHRLHNAITAKKTTIYGFYIAPGLLAMVRV